MGDGRVQHLACRKRARATLLAISPIAQDHRGPARYELIKMRRMTSNACNRRNSQAFERFFTACAGAVVDGGQQRSASSRDLVRHGLLLIG